ncbi:MAG: redoxin domain-containing protein [Acidobacteria bacterium]|nr:redoxin domain-containing protein [Acidobacteriota bacterium]
MGISVDSVPALKRFAEDIAVTFPLVSDFKRKVVRDYGIFDEERGFGTRATFVLDKEGVIKHVEQGNTAIDPASALDTCNLLSKPKVTPEKH